MRSSVVFCCGWVVVVLFCECGELLCCWGACCGCGGADCCCDLRDAMSRWRSEMVAASDVRRVVVEFEEDEGGGDEEWVLGVCGGEEEDEPVLASLPAEAWPCESSFLMNAWLAAHATTASL